MASDPTTSWRIDGGTMETERLYFPGLKITVDGNYNHKIKRCLLLGRKDVTNLESMLKNKDITLAKKCPSSQSSGFSSSRVWMWKLDYEESWALQMLGFQTVVLEKTLESTLNCKEIKPVNPKGNQFWTFIGRSDSEGESPILWPPDGKNWLIGNDPLTGKIRGRRRRG